MRQLSNTFLICLKSGFLSSLTEYVRNDIDLNLEIREGYINIYYKGNSLLKLCEAGSLLRYKAEIDPKFLEGTQTSLDFTEDTVPQFIKAIPLVKENINRYGAYSKEIEYEQMIIRANNYEEHNNTEYFIVDRQYDMPEGQVDLFGIYWDRDYRRPNQEVPLCLMEVKFALNEQIQEVHEQLNRYYEAVKNKASEIAEEMEVIFQQKLKLGLYSQEQRNTMKTLTFSRNIEKFQFILIFVDYNPNSTLLNFESIKNLPFANQVKIFNAGFGMWKQNTKPILE